MTLTEIFKVKHSHPYYIQNGESWRNFAFAAFQTGIDSFGVDNQPEWILSSLDELVNSYDSAIWPWLDRLSPTKSKAFRLRPSNVWYDDDCKTAKRLVRLRKRIFHTTRQSADKITWIQQLWEYRLLCQTKHILIWEYQIADSTMKRKKMWRAINSVLGRDEQSVTSKHSASAFAQLFLDKVEIRQDITNTYPPSYTASAGQSLC